MTASRNDWDPEEQQALAGVQDELDAIRARHQDGPSLELLRAARAGVLPDELQAAADRHLSKNAWSRALADGLDKLEWDETTLDPDAAERLLARIRKEIESKEAGASGEVGAGRRQLRPLFLAATVAAAALVIWMVVYDADEVSPSAPPESIAAAQPPSPPPFVLPLDKPEVTLSLAALTWRGPDGDNQLLADLKPGLDSFREDDYAAAERELTALASRYPGSIEILFYQGVSRLFLNDAPGAIASLAAAEAIGDATFAEDVSFYRAVAEERAGNRAEARTRLDTLCRSGGSRSARACPALDELDAAASTQ